MIEQRPPFFSIIVPTYNRPAHLGACLESLKRLDYPRDRFEVIIVDDGSRTPLEETVKRFRQEIDITLIFQEHGGPAMARNRGASHAKGTFLAFTDDDCTPSPEWLKALEVCLVRTPDRMIGGGTLNTVPNNLYSEVSHLLIEYLYSYYNADPEQARFFTSNNLALAADPFFEIGGFSPVFPRAAAEDREFCDRWSRHGHRMTYAPEALVYHLHALTLFTFCRQHFTYGRGAFHFRQMRTRAPLGFFRIEPLSFYSNMLSYPFSRGKKHTSFLFSALLILTQVANAGGYLWEWVRQQR